MKKRFLLLLFIFTVIMTGCGTESSKEKVNPVSDYINNSKKSAYIDSLSNFSSLVVNKAIEGTKLKMYNADVLYMIPVGNDSSKSCVSDATMSQSPFSNTWNYAFVGVRYTNNGYNYYVISEDGEGYGVVLTSISELHNNDDINKIIYSNSEGIDKELRDYLKDKYTKSNNKVENLSKMDKKMIEKISELSNVKKIEYISAPKCEN